MCICSCVPTPPVVRAQRDRTVTMVPWTHAAGAATAGWQTHPGTAPSHLHGIEAPAGPAACGAVAGGGTCTCTCMHACTDAQRSSPAASVRRAPISRDAGAAGRIAPSSMQQPKCQQPEFQRASAARWRTRVTCRSTRAWAVGRGPWAEPVARRGAVVCRSDCSVGCSVDRWGAGASWHGGKAGRKAGQSGAGQDALRIQRLMRARFAKFIKWPVARSARRRGPGRAMAGCAREGREGREGRRSSQRTCVWTVSRLISPSIGFACASCARSLE